MDYLAHCLMDAILREMQDPDSAFMREYREWKEGRDREAASPKEARAEALAS